MERTLSVLVENHFGVLAKIAGLFSARGYNIKSLSVAETEDPTISVMTIVVDEDERGAEQVRKQLAKLIDTLKVRDLTGRDVVERELALIKVEAPPNKRSEVLELVDIFKARIVDVSHGSVTVEVTGSPEKVSALISLLEPYGIKEMARTGKVALVRGIEEEKREKSGGK